MSAFAAPAQPPAAAGQAQPQARGWMDLLKMPVIVLQLGLLALALRQFQIENAAFRRVAILAFAGFVVHAMLPLRFRLHFFVGLSLASIWVALGATNAVWLVGLGLVLIGVCHLPVSFRIRGTLLVLLGTLLAVQRAGVVPSPWPEAIWPILGSMFMFRMILYFYDLRHDKEPATFSGTLSYFFMLPNACFGLFPVVDYKAWRRTYFDSDSYRIYAVGVDWMLRGVVQLILYRFVYYYWAISPTEVRDSGDLVRYMVANFLLYLRVSGQFHLIIGMLYLFGFRLPETHHRYFLASSFTDFWRRINIYWKDFMMKVFYYPAFFKLRKLGNTQALVLATIFVFVMTWFLHAYQWFWLRGSMFIVWQDIFFWTLLGALVVVNSLWEARHGRKRTLAGAEKKFDWWSASSVAVKTAATFAFICVLWSFWTADSVEAWLSMWRAAAESVAVGGSPEQLIGVSLLAGVVATTRLSGPDAPGGKPSRPGWIGHAALVTVSLVALVAVGIESLHTKFGGQAATVIHTLRSGRLSRLDNAKLERGYYENLLAVDKFNSQLWEVYMKKPSKWLDIDFANLKRFSDDFAREELIPSFVSNTNYGSISTNRWGMRDRDYEKARAGGTFRMAVIGPSTVMGWGVADGATFEAVLEDRLNKECRGAAYTNFEILNLGVPGYEPPQQIVAAERAYGFTPQALLYIAVPREMGRATNYMSKVVRRGQAIPYADLDSVVKRAGVARDNDETTVLRKLSEHAPATLTAVYGRIVREARARGVTPVWVFLPHARPDVAFEELEESRTIAKTAGFQIVDLSSLYAGQDVTTLRLAEWDDHPNTAAHKLIADSIYAAFSRNPSLLAADAAPRVCQQWGGR